MIPHPENDTDAVPPSHWPKVLRRGPMEMLATVLIAAGVLMMLQPFALTLYTWSFVTTLTGVVMFTFVTKFPE
jgi:VIT1/CCC1 family predicted Fe2+/Mn2+ transporter